MELFNDVKPGLNKSRHGLGDVITEHIGASPDVPLEVTDGVALVAHLNLRCTVLDSGLGFTFDYQIQEQTQYLGRSLRVSLTVVVL